MPPRRRWAHYKRAATLAGRPCTERSDRERADAAETVEMDVQEPVDVGHVPTAMEGLIHGGGAPSRTPAPTISPGDDSTSHSDSTQPEDRVGTVSAVGRAFQYTPATVAHAPSCSRDRTGSFVRFPDAKTGEAVQYQASKGSVSEYKGVEWRSTANYQHLIILDGPDSGQIDHKVVCEKDVITVAPNKNHTTLGKGVNEPAGASRLGSKTKPQTR